MTLHPIRNRVELDWLNLAKHVTDVRKLDERDPWEAIPGPQDPTSPERRRNPVAPSRSSRFFVPLAWTVALLAGAAVYVGLIWLAWRLA